MAVSRFIFALVILFGSTSWMGTNSVWMQLPLLTAHLPEGWGLPSYLAAIVQSLEGNNAFLAFLVTRSQMLRGWYPLTALLIAQGHSNSNIIIACVGPLVYSVLHKGFKNINLPTVPLITAFLTLACACEFGLVFMWWRTTAIGNGQHSLALYVLLFGLAIVNATSNVLFMPFMAQFNRAYLNAYFVGMGLSSLFPSLVSLAQGVGNYECEGAVPIYSPPRFSASTFFLIITVWTVTATISFQILSKSGEHSSAPKSADAAHEETPLSKAKSNTAEVNETSVALHAKDSPEVEVVPSSPSKRVKRKYESSYIIILVATAIVNAQMNGIVPSVTSYAALPYSHATYHYGITLANIVSPAMSFLPFFVTVRSIPLLCTMTICSSVVTAFIIFLAALSPNLIFDSYTMGSCLAIGASLVAAGLHSYLRVIFASLLREGEKSESRLFWCGVFIQIGSFAGSAVMFPLINFAHVFTSAPPCR